MRPIRIARCLCSHLSGTLEDGTLAEPPIALCEVQTYVYAAQGAIADVATRLSRGAESAWTCPVQLRAVFVEARRYLRISLEVHHGPAVSFQECEIGERLRPSRRPRGESAPTASRRTCAALDARRISGAASAWATAPIAAAASASVAPRIRACIAANFAIAPPRASAPQLISIACTSAPNRGPCGRAAARATSSTLTSTPSGSRSRRAPPPTRARSRRRRIGSA
jgi:hypothetical protein